MNPVLEHATDGVGTKAELEILRGKVESVAEQVFKEKGKTLDYIVGTMIELPRACLKGDEIAQGNSGAEFFSFGTNDLTQMTFGYSRDDIGTFLPDYLDKKMLEVDPFAQIDESGVGQLVELAVENGRIPPGR